MFILILIHCTVKMAQIDTYNTTYGKQYYYVLTCFKTSLYEGCVLCIQSIPESLAARMLNVVVLDLHSNQLQALPNSIGCLSKLKILNVSGNLLKSFPKTIEDCRYS